MHVERFFCRPPHHIYAEITHHDPYMENTTSCFQIRHLVPAPRLLYLFLGWSAHEKKKSKEDLLFTLLVTLASERYSFCGELIVLFCLF